jgi:hypothetical protein
MPNLLCGVMECVGYRLAPRLHRTTPKARIAAAMTPLAISTSSIGLTCIGCQRLRT